MNAAVLISSLVFTVPLAGVGVFYLVKNVFVPKMKTKKGYIQIYRVMPNGQLRMFWGKPEFETQGKDASGYFIQDGEEKLQFIDHPSMVVYKGNVRIAFYDPEGNQISLQEMAKYVPAIAPALLDSLATRTWNAARAAAFAEKRKLELFTIIAAGAAVLCLLFILGYGKRFDEILGKVSELKAVCQAAKTATAGVTPA